MVVQIKVGVTLLLVLLIVSITAGVSSFALRDHHSRKVLTGSVSLVGSVGMYGSPLVVMVSYKVFLILYLFSVKQTEHYFVHIVVATSYDCRSK